MDMESSPFFKNHMVPHSSNEEKSSSEFSCHNPNCKHEKAICRVFNELGEPVAFKDICQSHPVYLVGSKYSDSKTENSGLQESPPANNFQMRMEQRYSEDSPEVEIPKTPLPATRSGRKERKRTKASQKSGKKIPGLEKPANKRTKNAKSKGNSNNRKQSDSSQAIGKQVRKFEENKEKPMTCNCKKSRCLKFYCDCLAEGRM